jgi:hypothetical protein
MNRIQSILMIALASLVLASSASAGDLLDKYTPKIGDLNGDGRSDIFLKYRADFGSIDLDGLPIPIPLSRSTVADFVLQQTPAGGFSSLAPLNPGQRAAASSWADAEMPLLQGDYNADGRLDVYLKATQSSITGAQDAIAFAPFDDGAPPLAVTSIDSERAAFIRDAAGWVNDPSYFDSGLYYQTYVGYFRVAYFSCGGSTFTALADNPNLSTCFAGCAFLGVELVYGQLRVLQFDPTGFSTAALNLLARIAPHIQANGRFNIPAAEASVLRQQAMTVLGVPVFGQTTVDVPSPADWEGDYEWLKDLVRINPWLLLTLLVNTIPGDTEQAIFLWRVAGEVETAKLIGRVSQGKPPFRADNPSGFSQIQFWQSLDDARNFLRRSRMVGVDETLTILEIRVRNNTRLLCPEFQLSDGNVRPPRSCGPEALPSLNFDALSFGIKVRDVLLRGAVP